MPPSDIAAEATARPAPALVRWLNVLLALTALVSAWLLFQVQPMVAKRILPWFGGGTAVWTTAMLFFQSALFLGYLYAHGLTRLLAPQRQAPLHVALLAVAAGLSMLVGVIPADAWKPAANGLPALQILVLLAACVGLPYLMLSATAPLIQVWFARANPGRTPYRLYALSNIGSLAALVSYPFLIEPRIGVLQQGVIWSLLFVGFALLCALSGLLALAAGSRPAPTDAALRRTPGATPSEAEASPEEGPPGVRSSKTQRLLWVALPACASVLLLAITAFLCLDITSIPLLWMAPLVVYLLSFILTFESDRWYRRGAWLPALVAFSFAALFTWHNPQWLAARQMELEATIIAHLGLLLAAAMVCHGELAALRPPASQLTRFYLSISAGGALGGILTGIVAPLVMSDYFELQLAVAGVWILLTAIMVTDPASALYDGRHFARLAALALLFVALCVGMVMYCIGRDASTIAGARNFYGVIKVRHRNPDQPELEFRQLANGRISHGVQFLAPDRRRVASQYYHPETGVGLILAAPATQPRHVGVVGLGVGTLATYANPGDRYRFYDINPQVIKFADEYFTFLADARDRGVQIDVVAGDARLQLEREAPQAFDVLVLDAFTSDAIPAHLLTVEAFAVYFKHLPSRDAVLAVHISNKHLDLALVVQAIAEKFELDAQAVLGQSDQGPAGSESTWLILARPESAIAAQTIGLRPSPEGGGRPPVLWTDDYNNIVDVLY
ncbi:MAG TPA: fused MFS/spermidine synthase [Lacipirellulaceae bacterium]|nr:fused MFS/spermidine synthase [Lacipirellulaceae bacterium]